MTTRIEKNYVDHGFGFPVVIDQVEIEVVGNEEIPLIDYGQLNLQVIGYLRLKPSKLTGKEVRFLRRALEMTLQQCGTAFGVTHSAVIAWEKTGDEPTHMERGMEKLLRYAVQSLLPPRLREEYLSFSARLEELEGIPSPAWKDGRLHVSLTRDPQDDEYRVVGKTRRNRSEDNLLIAA